MLTRQNVFETSREGYRLLALQSAAIGRKLRRFLERVSTNGLVIQSFAFSEGHNERQLKALAVYARHLSQEAEHYLPAGVVNYQGVISDAMFELVANHYQFKQDVATASVAELRKMVECVVVLSDGMHQFAADVNMTALTDCPQYVYRNLPCSIVSDDKLWCVSGSDAQGGSGVLEWCYDESDAQDIFTSMKRFPERFKDLVMEKWSAVMAADESMLASVSPEEAFA